MLTILSFAKLPSRSQAWYTPVHKWSVFADPANLTLPSVHTIKTPHAFQKTPCPVTAKTTEAFTARQRTVAADADLAMDLEDLDELVSGVCFIYSLVKTLVDPGKPRGWRNTHSLHWGPFSYSQRVCDIVVSKSMGNLYHAAQSYE